MASTDTEPLLSPTRGDFFLNRKRPDRIRGFFFALLLQS